MNTKFLIASFALVALLFGQVSFADGHVEDPDNDGDNYGDKKTEQSAE